MKTLFFLTMNMKNTLALTLGMLTLTATTFILGFKSKADEQVRHIVVFKYKPEATQKQIQQVNNAFAALKDKIPGIISFEYGINNSPENKNQGFTHVYQVTFEDAEARDNYLPHPAHKKFGQLLGKLNILEDAFVVDYNPVK